MISTEAHDITLVEQALYYARIELFFKTVLFYIKRLSNICKATRKICNDTMQKFSAH